MSVLVQTKFMAVSYDKDKVQVSQIEQTHTIHHNNNSVTSFMKAVYYSVLFQFPY